MANYVDGFLLPLPKDKIEVYREMAEGASKLWLEHGALDYRECVGDDLTIEGTKSFIETSGAQENETVVFAFITYKSREHRDEVNAKVMADPRMKEMMEKGCANMPFDCAKMSYGGFRTIVGS